MARIRSIHPGLFTDDAYVKMSMTARVAWPGVWTLCDDAGVFSWHASQLKRAIFPDDDITFGPILEEWERLGVVMRVEIGGQHLGLVRNFCKFQSPKFPRYLHELSAEQLKYVGWKPKKGKETESPRPDGDVSASTPGMGQAYSRATPGLPHGEERRGEEREKNLSLSAPAAPSAGEEKIVDFAVERDFDEFWVVYPNDAAPDEARRAYRAVRRKGATAAQILAAVRRTEWRPEKRFVPHAARWLQGGSWKNPDASAKPAVAVPRVDPYPGWEVSDHMALMEWKLARDSGEWVTPPNRARAKARNALPPAERRADLLAWLEAEHPKVVRHIRNNEPDGGVADGAVA